MIRFITQIALIAVTTNCLDAQQLTRAARDSSRTPISVLIDSTGHDDRHAVRGAVVGGIAGATAGYLLSRTIHVGCTNQVSASGVVSPCDHRQERRVRAGVIVSSTLLGGLAGWLVAYFRDP